MHRMGRFCMDTLYIIIPAYNEQANIKKVVEDWYLVLEKYGSPQSKLVIVNDGSTDGTYPLLCEYSKTRPLLLPLTKPNSGHGPTVLYGYQYAISHGADWIFQTDSDGQTCSREFEVFWNERSQFDAIIGNRVRRGDGIQRKFIENVVCLLLQIIFGVRVPDANAPYRLMRANLVKKYIGKLPKDFNIPNIMFTTYFSYYGEKIKFQPITFQSRQGGSNSIDFKKIFFIGWKAIGDFRKLKKEMRLS